MIARMSPGDHTAQEIIQDVLAAPEFAGREPHWITQITLWLQSLWESISLSVARWTANISVNGEGVVLPKWLGLVVLLALIVVLYYALGRTRGIFVREFQAPADGYSRVPEESYRRLRQRALRNLERGVFDEALRVAYLAGLRLLWEKDLLPESTARTDREFLIALGDHPARVPFGQLSDVFSRHRYGLRRPGEAEARAVFKLLDQLHMRVHESSRQPDTVQMTSQVDGVE